MSLHKRCRLYQITGRATVSPNGHCMAIGTGVLYTSRPSAALAGSHIEVTVEQGKIFGIGYPKTATSSLSKALAILGYRSAHDTYDILPRFFPEELKDYEYDPQVLDRNDALSGIVCLVYKQLDQAYPGSKFILTVRDEHKWLKSALAHLQKNTTAEGRAMDAELPLRPFARAKLYNGDLWYHGEHTQDYLKTYREFNRGVLEYFKGRDDLLVMDIEQGDGWDKLCNFLGCPVPDKPLPWKNKRSLRRTLRRKLKHWRRKLGLSGK